MGKNITSQKAGKGSSTYRSPSHRFKGSFTLPKISKEQLTGKVTDIVRSVGHTSPVAEITYNNGQKIIMPAAEGLQVGDAITCHPSAEIRSGNILPLKNIPEGTLIFSIETTPGDGGKFVRSSGGKAKLLAKSGSAITVLLPSKKRKKFNENCRAVIGMISGGGRTDKPFLKAGNKFKATGARNKYWPKVSGTAMNAVDHPFGGSRSSRKGRPTVASRNAPPGRKVGMISPKKSGRGRGR